MLSKVTYNGKALAKKWLNKPKTLIKHQTYKEKTNFKL
jgi:hypothetical protein